MKNDANRSPYALYAAATAGWVLRTAQKLPKEDRVCTTVCNIMLFYRRLGFAFRQTPGADQGLSKEDNSQGKSLLTVTFPPHAAQGPLRIIFI